jgi:c-di-GMP-binding flagellar brake protein YcgR
MLHHGRVGFERRVFPRFKVELPIVYQREEQEAKKAQVQNVSQGGLLLTLEETVSPGERLRVKMHLTDKKGSHIIETVGRVVWVSLPPAGAGFHVGYAFEEIAPGDLKTLMSFETIWLEQGRA